MSYELFQQGPAAYIPVILVSLVITVVAYGAFPFILQEHERKLSPKRSTIDCATASNIRESCLLH